MLSFLSVGQWPNVSIVVRIRNFRVSNRTGLLFALNQSFLSLLNQQLNFQSFFIFFWGQLLFFSSLFFQVIIWRINVSPGSGWEEAPVKISRGKVVREPEVPWDLRASDSVSHQAPWALAFLAQLGVKYLEPSKCLLPHVFKSTGWFLNPQWASCSIPLPLCLILWPSLQAPSHDWTATIVALETSPEIRDICNN